MSDDSVKKGLKFAFFTFYADVRAHVTWREDSLDVALIYHQSAAGYVIHNILDPISTVSARTL